MIGIFGGTFDPIHLGHLNIAEHCTKQLSLEKLYFMPCATPPHKSSANVSADDRKNMINLAIKYNKKFDLDTRELNRTGASYTILSLRELNVKFPDQSILFLIGMDSLNTLDTWYHWQEITQLCHLVICQRPGQTFNPSVNTLNYLAQAKTSNIESLKSHKAGKAYFLKTPTLDVSSTNIRENITQFDSITNLLPKAVCQYIAQNNLYFSA
ncbi:nicotinate-nucleotide adenylyltransferase [Pseudoalteromonas denitrificans]|uniref:Probable nicotinate-nucleotide adenylyltransferase n=1 Tax=Pseudoalteromonas denitrificans DSM 6059 TaxID=1123010 RepID=A0A1I1HY94_9GAMM|nr:nicotinate-nucleotide adenylyltransferase [Pseudoalteromonas denitrificans]SFC29129.1 nicotinate-nucleotide adenylyltransferase [Pseudoalteromonas denitrificans DSM 6059]